MPKYDKPILHVNTARAYRYHFCHWETLFHDSCLVEGYRNPAKDRLTQSHRRSQWRHQSKKISWASCSLQRNPFIRMEHSRWCDCLQDSCQWCWQAMDWPFAPPALSALLQADFNLVQMLSNSWGTSFFLGFMNALADLKKTSSIAMDSATPKTLLSR